MKLSDETLVTTGETPSRIIGEEKFFNRIKVKTVDEYVDLMNNLKLPNRDGGGAASRPMTCAVSWR
jgi:sulfur dioxygenase